VQVRLRQARDDALVSIWDSIGQARFDRIEYRRKRRGVGKGWGVGLDSPPIPSVFRFPEHPRNSADFVGLIMTRRYDSPV